MANDTLFSRNRKKRKLKDKKIQFYKYDYILDKYGTPTSNKALTIMLNNIWAYARQTSATEELESKYSTNFEYKTDMIFTINFRKGISNDWVIRYDGNLYNINRIDLFEGYKEDITIGARLIGAITDQKYKDGINSF